LKITIFFEKFVTRKVNINGKATVIGQRE